MRKNKFILGLIMFITYFMLGGMVAPINSLFQINVNNLPNQVLVNEPLEISTTVKNRALLFQEISYGPDYIVICIDNESVQDNLSHSIMYEEIMIPFTSNDQITTIKFSTPGIHKINIYAKFYIGDELVTYEETVYIEVIG